MELDIPNPEQISHRSCKGKESKGSTPQPTDMDASLIEIRTMDGAYRNDFRLSRTVANHSPVFLMAREQSFYRSKSLSARTG
ncbi:hypothetical protein VNO77_38893 [Canavalia gladiata]|uniref:Uncharacterized protein n=1 Tax=Canavalia gladiata TaxID=3824 RepID=A0AAN9PXR0_CANGL